MSIPTLNTPRLTLRPFTLADVPRMHGIINQDGVLDYFPESAPFSMARVELSLTRILKHWQERGYGLWGVVRATDNILLGRCGMQYLPDTDEIEIDYMLARDAWGQGFATEAGKATLDYAFNKKAFTTVVGIVHTGNFGSQRVLEKLGMVHTAQKDYFGMDCFRYAIDRADFLG